jgi:hypothetical protein
MSTPRLQYLIEHYGQSLTNRLSQEDVLTKEIALTPQESVLKFSLSDPSRNKSATQWLITTYLNDGFRLEDLLGDKTSKVHNTLMNFGLYRGKLPVSARSLNRYKTLADVYASIEEFIPQENDDLTLSGKALKRSEREKAHQETEFIHQGDDGFMIVSPKTQFASKWWGKGTQWCTASDNNNMFEYYYKEAPLLILIMPNADKLQLHVGKYEAQFMDARDNEVSDQYIEEHWEILKPIMFSAVKEDGRILEYIPEQFRNIKVCREAVKQNGRLLYLVNKEFRDKELCWSAIRQNGRALIDVPDELRDKEICLEAVRQNGYALEYVPWKFRDKELNLEAIGQNGYALDFVPTEFRDKEICSEAIKQNGQALQYVPEALRDQEICLEAVKQNGQALYYVPNELRDYELCLEAIRQNGLALGCIPDELRDKEICLEALKQSGRALQYVPKELRDKEIYLDAVKQDGRALEFVPVEFHDKCHQPIDVLPDWTETYAKLKQELSLDTIGICPSWT